MVPVGQYVDDEHTYLYLPEFDEPHDVTPSLVLHDVKLVPIVSEEPKEYEATHELYFTVYCDAEHLLV